MNRIANKVAALGTLGLAWFNAGCASDPLLDAVGDAAARPQPQGLPMGQPQTDFPISKLKIENDGTLCVGRLPNSPTIVTAPMRDYRDPKTNELQEYGDVVFTNPQISFPNRPPMYIQSVYINKSGNIYAPDGTPDFPSNIAMQIASAATLFQQRCAEKLPAPRS